MDDRAQVVDVCRQFTCPGEERPIDRPTHLARLAAFWPPCLGCDSRHDTAGLTSLQQSARAEVERHANAGWRWEAEGPTTSTHGQIDDELPRQLAFAFAEAVWESAPVTPVVHVGTDGSRHVAGLLQAVCRGLELAGCIACEVGAVTTPALALGVAGERAAGALWIGNAGGEGHELSILAFGAQGAPWSLPGGLTQLQIPAGRTAARPKRGGGRIQRFDSEQPYLASLAGAFHGLRPLSFVLHTRSETFLRYWIALAHDTACQARPLPRPASHVHDHEGDAESERTEIPLTAIANEVLLAGTHFGVWVDGAGEQCRFVDERGVLIAPSRIATLLGRGLATARGELFCRQRGLENEFAGASETDTVWQDPQFIGEFEQLSREKASLELGRSVSGLATDGAGRYWVGDRLTPDALVTLCLLLNLLSESDRPLSEVLDAAIAAK